MSNATGLLHALVLDGAGGATELDWAGVLAWKPEHGTLWLNLDYTAADVSDWLVEHAKVEDLTRDALIEHDPRPRAVLHTDDLFVVLRGINQNHGAEPEDMISIRVHAEPSRVITLRHRGSRSVTAVASELRARKGPRSASELLGTLIDRVVDHIVLRVDTLADDISHAEERVLAETRGELRTALAELRRRALALRRFLGPQREGLTRLVSIAPAWVDQKQRERISESAEHMSRAIEELETARDRAAVTQEELASRLTEQTNQRLYVLSLITAVFLPLGFVCALLGVNIGGIPLKDESWAFWALCGAFIVGVGAQLWFFRKRGWL